MKKQIGNKSLFVKWIGPLRVFYSYDTPIVVVTPDGTLATSKKFSVTTTKHQNYVLGEYLNYPSFETVTQDELELLIQVRSAW